MNASVLLISNDVVPGMTLPVAAPGLRTWGLMVGLRDRGFDAHTVVVRNVVERVWERATPPPTPANVTIEPAERLGDIVEAQRPGAVVICNSNQIDRLRPVDGVRFVYDFFAPKMLELAYHHDVYDVEQAARLRDRKLRALELADAIIVNGAKKVPYVLGWLLQQDRDPRTVPVSVVPMAVPSIEGSGETSSPVRLAMSGYVQPWSMPGGWTTELAALVEAGTCTLDVLLSRHWGRPGDEALPEELEHLLATDGVRAHPPQLFSDFRARLGSCDVSIDLFARNLEREYAMITRTVVALASGLAVVHPPFTELSPIIADAEAGWLVDGDDSEAAGAALRRIVADPGEVARRKQNARRLASEVFAPERAVAPLADLLETWLG